eukprot:12048803-Ditylum_brightwellii.AAC.1
MRHLPTTKKGPDDSKKGSISNTVGNPSSKRTQMSQRVTLSEAKTVDMYNICNKVEIHDVHSKVQLHNNNNKIQTWEQHQEKEGRKEGRKEGVHRSNN